MLSFGEYRPDVADYEGQHTKNILNVVPQGDGYGPVQDFASFTSALAATCRGFFYALKNDGSIQVFAGTSTKLYVLNNTSQTWTDASLGAGTYTALASTAQWQFAQFNNFVFAVHQGVNPQVYDLTSSSAFADLAGSPPKAAYIAVVNRFLVISGLASPNVYRIQWSGLNDTTNWTSGVNDSDFQDLADGGVVRGVAGGEFGVIFQDRSIRRMTFQPGSDIVFGIDRISKDDGLLAPYSLVNAGDKIFFYSPRGFEKIESGLAPQQIGKERVDRTFAMDLDANNLQLFIGGVDPQKPRVFFVYKSVNSGVSTQFDSMLVYDWILDRWSKISMSGEFIASLARNGLTLEQVDAAYNTASPVSLTSVTTSTSAVTFGLVAHGLTAGQGIIFPNAIVGLAANTPYYVKSASLTSSSFNVSASGGVGTLAGAAVGTTSTSTGAVTTTFVQSSIDTLSIGSLDAITIATEPAFAMSQSNKVGFFTGNTLEATMETAEHASSPSRRIFVRGYKPICDAAGVVGNVSIRETQQATATHTSEATVDTLGNINARVSTRYARGKIRIPAGTDWSFAAGIEPDVSQEGER